MDRYLILDTLTNEVIWANDLEFKNPNDGTSEKYETLADAIQGAKGEIEWLEKKA